MRTTTKYVYRPALRTFRSVSGVLENTLAYIGEVFLLFVKVVRYMVSPGDPTEQMVFIGVNSLPIALITITFSGMVLSLYTAKQMQDLGVGSLVGGLVGITMSRELAPVLAAIVVAARAGSSIAAELGSMKVTEQIDALRTLATDPVQYLVVPRFIACVTMLPVVALFGVVIGTLGGYLVASTVGVSWSAFRDSIIMWVNLGDIISGLVKTLVFGAIIAMVSCHQGLTTTGGATGVGQATTRAVVLCIVFIYAADFLIVRLIVTGQAQ